MKASAEFTRRIAVGRRAPKIFDLVEDRVELALPLSSEWFYAPGVVAAAAPAVHDHLEDLAAVVRSRLDHDDVALCHLLAERLFGLERLEQARAPFPPGVLKKGCACPARSTKVTGSPSVSSSASAWICGNVEHPLQSRPRPRSAERHVDETLEAAGDGSDVARRTRSTSRIPPYCRPSCRQTPRGRAPAPLPATGASRARSSSLFLSTHPSHGDEPPALRWGETGGSSVVTPRSASPQAAANIASDGDATPAARRRPWSSGPATEVADDLARIADDATDDSLLQWWNADPRPPWRVVRRGSPPSPLVPGGGPRLIERSRSGD